MMQDFEGCSPDVDKKTFIADGAQVIGAVKMKEFSSIWFNAVVRGDVNRIEIGCYSNVQDNSVVHVADTLPTIIGDYVTIGHNAIVHGCTIENHCLIGMGAILLNGSVIGTGSIVGAGAVVRENQVIPPYSLVVGVPGKIVKSTSGDAEKIRAQAIKYKTLWTERYKILPDADGERYYGEEIV